MVEYNFRAGLAEKRLKSQFGYLVLGTGGKTSPLLYVAAEHSDAGKCPYRSHQSVLMAAYSSGQAILVDINRRIGCYVYVIWPLYLQDFAEEEIQTSGDPRIIVPYENTQYWTSECGGQDCPALKSEKPQGGGVSITSAGWPLCQTGPSFLA